MAKRQKQWAKAKRIELMMMLGYCCAHCGTEGDRRNQLGFDCIEPRGDAHHRYDTSQRMSFYWREHRAKNIQILCARCNGKKSHTDVEVPF